MYLANKKIATVITHSDFFNRKPINIRKTLTNFSKEFLINTVAVLGCNFGNACYPDNKKTLFSPYSEKHMDELNSLFDKYVNKYSTKYGVKSFYCTYRTTLELLRYIYSIPYDEFQDTIPTSDKEYTIFKILLSINEILYSDKLDTTNINHISFYFDFAINELNINDISYEIKTQSYYCKMLFEFLEKTSNTNDLYGNFLKEYEIMHWKEYVSTIYCILGIIHFAQNSSVKYNPAFNIDMLPQEVLDKISKTVLNKLSLNVEDTIPFDSDDYYNRDNNIDYRVIRSYPIIVDKDKNYYVINSQILCEQLYNSMYFILKKLYRNKNFDSFYYKRFVEEYLFHRTMLLICDGCNKINTYTPSKRDILSPKPMIEHDNQPDFYMRNNTAIFLCECKAFKINGAFKEKGTIKPLIKTFYSKVVRKENNDDSAVIQLLKQIELIDTYCFPYDKKIPNIVSYYPIIIFEDPKLACAGASATIQEWFNIELPTDYKNSAYGPIITTSIDVLFMYSDIFRSRGLKQIIDRYLNENAKYTDNVGWQLSPHISFNDFMHESYGSPKQSYFDKFTEQVLCDR